MFKVEIKDMNDMSLKLFYCDGVTVSKAVPNRFVELYNKRAKVKTCQILLKPSQVVSVSEDK